MATIRTRVRSEHELYICCVFTILYMYIYVDLGHASAASHRLMDFPIIVPVTSTAREIIPFIDRENERNVGPDNR